MKKWLLLISLAMLVGAQPLSPPAATKIAIDGKTISVKYSAPSMRGRTIFGELVPYGKVWRAGANTATAPHTDVPLDIGGLNVPKGNYSLYALPTRDTMLLIVNKDVGQAGDRYNQDRDLGRVRMNLGKAAAPMEQFKITLSTEGGKSASLKLEWEEMVATIPITVK